MLSQEDALGLVERRRRAWLDADLGGYLALWTEDMTFQSPLHAEPLRGRDAFAELVARSLATARPVRFDLEHLAVWGDVVLAEWCIAIERRGSGGGGRRRGMWLSQMRGGSAARPRGGLEPAAAARRRRGAKTRRGVAPPKTLRRRQ